MNPVDSHEPDEAALRELLHRRADADLTQLDLAEGAIARAGRIRARRRTAGAVLALGVVATTATAAWQLNRPQDVTPAAATPSPATQSADRTPTPLPTVDVPQGGPASSSLAASPPGDWPLCDATNSRWSIQRGTRFDDMTSYVILVEASGYCRVTGYPGVSLRDDQGRIIGAPADRGGPSPEPVPLAPGQSANAGLRIARVPATGCTRVPAAAIGVYAPDSPQAVSLPVDGETGCAEGSIHLLGIDAFVGPQR